MSSRKKGAANDGGRGGKGGKGAASKAKASPSTNANNKKRGGGGGDRDRDRDRHADEDDRFRLPSSESEGEEEIVDSSDDDQSKPSSSSSSSSSSSRARDQLPPADAKSKKDLRRERKLREQLEGKAAALDFCESTVTIQGRAYDADESTDEATGDVECIKIDRFSIAFRGEDLLHDTSLKLVVGHRYGLVGPNGAGKSTLLRHIAARQLPGIPSNLQILHVEQEVVGDDTPAVESVLLADTQRIELEREKDRLETALDDTTLSDKLHDEHQAKLQEVYEQLTAIGAASAKARAAGILSGLQFTPTMQQLPTKSFSGGWRMRIALARALFCRPAVLLLDEPTNHLDLHALVWLESYLSRWKKTLLIVSHDKNFLNSVCTDIIHLCNKKLDTYRGTFDSFQKTAKLRMKEQEVMWNKRKALEDEIKKLKSGDQSKSQKDRKKAAKSRHTPEQINALVKQKERALSKMPEVQAPPKDYRVTFEFPDPDRQLPHPVIQVQDVDFAYPVDGKNPDPDAPLPKSDTSKDKQEKGKRFMAKDGARPGEFVFRKLNFGIDMDSRIALVGRNGAGKTTLLHLMAKNLIPVRGHVEHATRLRIGWFAQHFADQLETDLSPVQYLHQKYPEEDQQTLRKYLGTFGLPGKRHLQAIKTLSGGEKNRVVFASIALNKCHLLFLDEPTNHLDMESIAALAKGLKKYAGGVVLVSHDQRLISAACSEILVVDDQNVERFEGDINDYREMLIEEMDLDALEEV